MMVKVAMRQNGRCKRGSRHLKGRKGCWSKGRSHMSGKGKKK